MPGPIHQPILTREILSFIKDGHKVIVDVTAGEGGHILEVLKESGPREMLLCIDIDPEILKRAQSIIKGMDYSGMDYSGVYFVNDNFSNIDNILKNLGQNTADIIIADLGISNYHFLESGRGFSFNDGSLLDMRLNNRLGMPLYKVLQSMKEIEIEKVLSDYADERHAKRLAKAIYHKRKDILTAKDLARTVENEIGSFYRGKIHPATKSFMAFRIFINEELKNLKHFLEKVPYVLSMGGRVLVISFHSAEDRIVKDYFKKFSFTEKVNKYKKEVRPVPLGRVLTKKPIKPGRREVINNPRARSAKLRVFERS